MHGGRVPIQWLVGTDGAASLYEDDGKTFAHKKGAWMKIEMSWRDTDRMLTLNLAKGSRMLPPSKRSYEVRLAGEQATRTVVFDGRPLDIRL